MAIAQNLNFNVAGIAHQPLHVDTVHAKGRLRLGPAPRISLGQGVCAHDGPHATPATTANGLDHDADGALFTLRGRVQSGRRLLRREKCLCLGQAHHLQAARKQGNPLLMRQCTRLGLVTKQRQLGRRWADKADAGIGAGLCKVSTLAQESIAGMDGITARLLRQGNDALNVEIGARPGIRRRTRR